MRQINNLRPKCDKVGVHGDDIDHPIGKGDFTDVDKFSGANGIFDINGLKIAVKESMGILLMM